jgi:hypothetical protein
MFFHPRATSSSAKLVPTMPAPMMTTRCDVVMLGSLWMDPDSAFEAPEDEELFKGDLGSSFWARDIKEYWLLCV